MASHDASEMPSTFGNDTVVLPSRPRNLLLDGFYTIIACLAVLGNGMVIAVMMLRRRMFSSFTNRLILHQSIIDTIVGVVFFFYTVVRKLPILVSSEGNIYDELACRFGYSAVFLWCVNVASTYNLVIISLERFMATCYPVKYRNTWSVAKLKYAMVASWAIGVVYGSHLLFVFEPRQGLCQVVQMGLGLQVCVGVLVVLTEYVVPLTIMIFAYTKILLMLTKKLGNPVNSQQHSLTKAKKNVLVTILLASIMFAVCWTPTEFDYVDELFFNNSFGDQVYERLTGLLACNMFINPIIYCFNYKHFRSQLKDLVLKRFRGNQVHAEQNISLSTDPLRHADSA